MYKYNDKIAIIWLKKNYNAQFDKMRSKLYQLNFDSAVAIWFVLMQYILWNLVTIILNH